MSLPYPRTSATTASVNVNRKDKATIEWEQRIDGPLIALTNVCGGDLRRLLYSFFSFLHRRTDFYIVASNFDVEDEAGLTQQKSANMGFQPGDAEKILLAAFRQFPLRKISPLPPASNAKKSESSPTMAVPLTVQGKSRTVDDNGDNCSQKSDSSADSDNSRRTRDKNVNSSKNTKGKPNDQQNQSSSEGGACDSDSRPTPSSSESTTAAVATRVRYTEEGLQIPVDNGGATSQYVWTQTLEECTVLIPINVSCQNLPNNNNNNGNNSPNNQSIRGKDLNVIITPTHISIRLKQLKQPTLSSSTTDSVPAVLDGTLHAEVVPAESSWTLEGGVITLSLYKKQKTFWKCVIVGDEEIDATLVDSKRHIQTYDPLTQAQIRKIIFDQNQQSRGLPTSDQILQQSNLSSQPNSVLRSKIPSLPPGVEYINQDVIDANLGTTKGSNHQ